jgi:Holliday junction resolvase RusA-like endonuclease
MIDRAQIVVPGCPQPAERARQGKGSWYTPPATEEYRQRIGWAWRQAGSPTFDTAPLACSMWFHIERPPSHRTKGGALRKASASQLPPGDLDNYAKSVLDALQKVGAFKNDVQVMCLSGVGKTWAHRGQARTTIDLWVTA